MPSTFHFAKRYVALGWRLTHLPPASKAPIHDAWGLNPTPAEHWIDHPDDNVGIILGASGVMSLDIDAPEAAARALDAVGIKLADLMCAPDAVGIKSREGRAKLLYSIPPSLRDVVCRKRQINWREIDGTTGKPVIEFRAGSSQLQDVLPPSIHPDTGLPYAWIGEFENLPTIPDALAALWIGWDEARAAMMAVDPNARRQYQPVKPKRREIGVSDEGESVIDRFCETYDVRDVMRWGECPSTYEEQGARYKRIGSTSAKAGVVVLPCQKRAGMSVVYSHHAGDALLGDGYAHDAFSVYARAVHGDDVHAAVKAAAEMMGMIAPVSQPSFMITPETEEERQLLDSLSSDGASFDVEKFERVDDDSSLSDMIDSLPEDKRTLMPMSTIREIGFAGMHARDEILPAMSSRQTSIEHRSFPVAEADDLAQWVAGRINVGGDGMSRAKFSIVAQTTLAILCHVASNRYVLGGSTSGAIFSVVDNAAMSAPTTRVVHAAFKAADELDTTGLIVRDEICQDATTPAAIGDHYGIDTSRMLLLHNSFSSYLERESRQSNAPTFRSFLARLFECVRGVDFQIRVNRNKKWVDDPAATALLMLSPAALRTLRTHARETGLVQSMITVDARDESATVWIASDPMPPAGAVKALAEMNAAAGMSGDKRDAVSVAIPDDAKTLIDSVSTSIENVCAQSSALEAFRGCRVGWRDSALSIAIALAAVANRTDPVVTTTIAQWVHDYVIDAFELLAAAVTSSADGGADIHGIVVECVRDAGRRGATRSDVWRSVSSYRNMSDDARARLFDELIEQELIVSASVSGGVRYWAAQHAAELSASDIADDVEREVMRHRKSGVHYRALEKLPSYARASKQRQDDAVAIVLDRGGVVRESKPGGWRLVAATENHDIA